MPTIAKRKKNAQAIDRPISAAILAKARSLAKRYGIILWQEDGSYVGSSVELPLCIGVAKSPEACVRETRQVMTTAIACDLEDGMEPPPVASANQRTEQVNIRLSPLERRRLEVAADAGGYHGVSDYIRDRVLASA